MDISRVQRIALIAWLMAAWSCTPADSVPPDPRIALSGVIEGFYGPPWPHADRLDLIRFMGRVGLDAYVYAPKDDPYHLARWREPYPADRLAELAEVATVARESGVQAHYAISPGGSMVYSDSTEYATLIAKLDAISTVGFDQVALFLDDVSPELAHDADRAAFDDLAHAHATIIDRLYEDLTARGIGLSVTPTTYTDAWGDPAYARRLGVLTNPAVPFYWTGTDVTSPTITLEDGERWTTLLSRRPLIWDNYPVNDFARWRLFLGPVRGRGADLGYSILGLLSNPMNEAHASMIPLATLAAYARDPSGYDPDVALEEALSLLFDDSTASALRPFLAAYGDYSTDRNAFEPLFIPGRDIDIGETEKLIGELRAALEDLGALSATRTLVAEIIADFGPFVDQADARLRELIADKRLYTRNGNMLRYHSALDTYSPEASAETLVVDGDFQDWGIPNFYPLFRNGRELRPNPRIAFRTQGDRLVLAVNSPRRPESPRSSPAIGVGDHIAIVIQHDNDANRQGLSEDDLLLLMPAPGAEPTATVETLSMRFHGFMSKYLADNRNMQFNAFHVTTFGQPPTGAMAAVAAGVRYRARTEGAGWRAEISIPMDDGLRLGLFVTRVEDGSSRTYSWSRRSYPANPATYVRVTRR
ncbi:MAG: protein O-GlcNAcase [Gemmatimonadales bacterium]